LANFLEKIFGSYSGKEIKRLMPIVDKIESLKDIYASMTDEELRAMTDKLIEEAFARYCAGDPKDWDIPGLGEYMERMCLPAGTFALNQSAMKNFDASGMISLLKKEAENFYARREDDIVKLSIDMRELERNILLRSVDTRWMDHIDAMDTLRDGIGLRAYAQRDPVNEYKMESYDMFDEMVRLLQEDTIHALYQLRIEKAPERREVAKPTRAIGSEESQPTQKPRTTIAKKGEKVGRNSPCPCGSGKKYKNCHGKNAGAAE